MVNLEPDVRPMGRYSTAETCRILGIHRNTLLKYTKMGCLKPGVRKTTAKRFYWGADIIKFWKGQM